MMRRQSRTQGTRKDIKEKSDEEWMKRTKGKKEKEERRDKERNGYIY